MRKCSARDTVRCSPQLQVGSATATTWHLPATIIEFAFSCSKLENWPPRQQDVADASSNITTSAPGPAWMILMTHSLNLRTPQVTTFIMLALPPSSSLVMKPKHIADLLLILEGRPRPLHRLHPAWSDAPPSQLPGPLY